MEISGVTFSCGNQHVLELYRSNPEVQQIEEAVKAHDFPCVIDNGHIIVAESEVRNEKGCHPYSIVLVMRAKAPCKTRPFVTWMSAQTGEGRSLSGGHYDLTLTDACADYQERCKAYEVNLGESFGPAIKRFALAGREKR
jgi:hypothetical protein